MLEIYITQVRRPKGVSSEREAFVSHAAQASAAACTNKTQTIHIHCVLEFIGIRPYFDVM